MCLINYTPYRNCMKYDNYNYGEVGANNKIIQQCCH